MAKRKPASPLEGCWNIVSMSGWDEEYLHAQEQAFIEIGPEDIGDFHFGYVRGDMDCRATERDGKPAFEFTWDGNDDTEHAFGRGWAVLDGDELKGVIFFHLGDDTDFTAKRAGKTARRKK